MLLLHYIIIVDISNKKWNQNSLLPLRNEKQSKNKSSQSTTFHFKQTLPGPIWFRTMSAPMGQLIFEKPQIAILCFTKRKEMVLIV